ncbi:MAG: hypothetical protein AAGD14_11130 [Planctomycetota bacterium]
MTWLHSVARLVASASMIFVLTAVAQAQDGRDPTIPSQDLREVIGQPGRTAAAPVGVVEIKPNTDDPKRLAEARFVNVALSRVADELGRATRANVVVSKSVAEQLVTITLRDVDLAAALGAIAIAQGLVARYDSESRVHFLATAEEIRGDLAAFRTTRTEVFTLLYPNARDVVRAIRGAFGDRVVVTEEDEFDDQAFEELQNRFRRFDLVESRRRGLTGSGTVLGAGAGGFGNFNRSRRNRFRNDRFRNRVGRLGLPLEFRPPEDPELTPAEARLLAEARAGAEGAAAEAERLATRRSLTYVTAIQRLNRIVVRSGDPHTLREIQGVINRMDVPTPLVLLEVRVLRVALSDGLDTSFDVTFQSGDGSGAFTTGEIAAPAAGSVLPGGTGVNLSAGVFQVVSSNFQARLQLLQTKGRVTSLATPILLTANNEVSRIFSGEEVPITIGFTEPQVITNVGGTTVLPGTPITEIRDVGTDLLITANINADRTVTLRLVQETSTVNEDGGSILVPTGETFTSQSIDTVQSQSASGTIVARDGLLLAFGGLIEETETDQREQVPVLGDLPLIGFFFRRESSVIQRSELIVLVRPYVLSTPVEGDQISKNLLDALSIHPYRPGEGGSSGNEDDWGVFRDKQPPFNRTIFDLFRFHTVPSFNTGAQGGGTR